MLVGNKAYRERKGIFALTQEELNSARKNGGSIKCAKGMCVLALKDRRRISNEGVISQGKIPWLEREITKSYCGYSEKEYFYILSQSPLYQRQKSPAKAARTRS